MAIEQPQAEPDRRPHPTADWAVERVEVLEQAIEDFDRGLIDHAELIAVLRGDWEPL